MERGGYDRLSEERMAWRALLKPAGFTNQHEGAMTFQLKSLYYRNLAYVLFVSVEVRKSLTSS